MKLVLVILIFLSLNSFAQELRIPGQILDDKKNPLENVVVELVGTNTKTITDVSGIFSLVVPSSIKKESLITIRATKSGYRSITKQIAASPLVISLGLTKIKGFVEKSKVISNVKADTVIKGSQYNLQGSTISNSAVGTNATVNNTYNEKHLQEADKNYILSVLQSKQQYNISNDTVVVSHTTNSNGAVFEYELVQFLKLHQIPVTQVNGWTISQTPIINAKIEVKNGKMNIIVGVMITNQ